MSASADKMQKQRKKLPSALMSARQKSENSHKENAQPSAATEKRRNNQSARELLYRRTTIYYSTTTCLFVYANELEVDEGVEKIYGAQLMINPTAAAPTRACAIFCCVYTICCYKKHTICAQCIESVGVRWIIWVLYEYRNIHTRTQITTHSKWMFAVRRGLILSGLD